MKKLKMNKDIGLTLEDGCNLYLKDCKQRNLRADTIRHYEQSYMRFYRYFDPMMKLSDITSKTYEGFVLHLKETIQNDVSINSYLRDFIATMHFLMDEGYIERFKMRAIKVDKWNVETYTDEELKKLLQKPNTRACTFMEYQCWVISNFLFSTGVRQRSLIHIQIKDIDFEQNILTVKVTKNRKPLLIPLSTTMIGILKEYLKHRQHKSNEEYLFCNIYGKQMTKGSSYKVLYTYNKGRGVETTGIHRYRHTFAKQWILNGGNVVSLSRILGHSNLSITQNYINLLVSDLGKQVEEVNLLERFAAKKKIRM